ncbi:DNA-directed RNA polymerase I subunit RPA49 isoform X1 [Oryzias latipes]|uniref:RNA polymerase I subunit E n=2 Tax=Oryzias latipes TaxID=8090 RepID=H2LKD2_ORYLA|nr:DNA-directed RNA polymerase I subunit RPA49 isoform X1 [Oryzias latipes]
MIHHRVSLSFITTTIMAASCRMVCCEEERESDKAIIVRFSNGFTSNAEELDFATFKNIEENNPRKKIRRIVVAESDRLSYVGQNFGEDLMKCNNLCRYYVGVLNKETMQMEIHSAQLFNMQPVIPGEATHDAKPQDTTLSYREKVDSLIEAFGTNKQKRALSSRRLNQVGSDALHHAVAEAASTVIDNKGLEALQQEVAETESQGALSLHLPPCNADADKKEDVYPFEELLSPVEFAALEPNGQKMTALSQEELQKLKDQRGNLCVMKHLENMPSASEPREKTARCAFYLSLLIKLAHQKIVTRKFWTEEGCPRVIQSKILRTFTVETYNNGRVQNIVSTSMRAKIAAHSLALLLHLGDMTVNLSLLHRDLEINEARMLEIAKSMGLTISKPARGKGDEAQLQDEHRYASLVLPLIKYDKFVERRKRKKMH